MVYAMKSILNYLLSDSACPVSGWWMPLINGFAVRLGVQISIWICRYGYLRVTSSSLETDILTSTYNFPPLCVSSASG